MENSQAMSWGVVGSGRCHTKTGQTDSNCPPPPHMAYGLLFTISHIDPTFLTERALF